MLKFIFLFL